MAKVETVSVSILGKAYQVNCKPDEVESLRESAQYLDMKMQEIKSSASILGLDRIAVMAALNIANDYLDEAKKTQMVVDHQEQKIQNISSKLDSALIRLKSENQ